MATLYLLGTGAVVSDPHRTTTMLAVENKGSVLVIDCGGDVVQRLISCGIDLERIAGLIITHEHADHVGGFPLMMEKLWLTGRRAPLDVYGIRAALEQARSIHDAFDTSSWPGYPGVRYREISLAHRAAVLADSDWEIHASPNRHSVPGVALRIRDRHGGGELAYSCDTAFAPEVVDLARGVPLLIHEATCDGPGHSTAMDAARAAVEAKAQRLVLVHLPPEELLDDARMGQARDLFRRTEKGEEGGSYAF